MIIESEQVLYHQDNSKLMIKALRHKDKDGLLDGPTLNFRKALHLGNHKKESRSHRGERKNY